MCKPSEPKGCADAKFLLRARPCQGCGGGKAAGRGGGRDGDRDGDGDGEIFVLQDLELKGGREGTQQHGPGAILEGAIGSCRDPTSLS